MASVASGLFKSLPKPKYTGEDEEIPSHAQQRGPRVLGAGALDESQIVLRVWQPVSISYTVYYDILMHVSREPVLRRTATERDGDRERLKILAMAAPFQKFSSHNIRSIWVVKAARRHLML
jgi:hypothetical protein